MQKKTPITRAIVRDTLTSSHVTDHKEFLQGWEKFLQHLVKLDLYDAPNLKRIIDGRALAKALGVPPGTWMGKALDICMAWQLRNPAEKTPDGAIQEVRDKAEDLGIKLK